MFILNACAYEVWTEAHEKIAERDFLRKIEIEQMPLHKSDKLEFCFIL